jgi:methylated-DNA-[protein]-cysteine S-methyltransferase
MYYFTKYQSPISAITLACEGDKLVGLWMEDQRYYGASISAEMTERNDLPIFRAARRWLNGYFAGEKPGISELPLAPIGSAFRQCVWRI